MVSQIHIHRITVQEARQCRGRFVFSPAQVFGRVGAPAIRLLGAIADARGNHGLDGDLLAAVLMQLVDALVCSPPRTVRASLPMPALVFIDGACEPGTALPDVGVGACLFEPGGTVEYFGGKAGHALVSEWASRPDQQVIAQAELVPTLLALSTWGARLRGRPVVFFIDNDRLGSAWCPVTRLSWPRRHSSLLRGIS